MSQNVNFGKNNRTQVISYIKRFAVIEDYFIGAFANNGPLYCNLSAKELHSSYLTWMCWLQCCFSRFCCSRQFKFVVFFGIYG